MFFLKPFFKTVVFSSLTFLLIVILGMKYHWVSLVFDNENEPKEVITVDQPSNTVTSEKSNTETFKKDQVNGISSDQLSIFEPLIIDEKVRSHGLKNMTKAQLTIKCQQLFSKLYDNSSRDNIFVGNCVVSNFHEVFQESPIDYVIDAKQVEAQRIKADHICRSQKNNKSNLLPIETELLIGICVSNIL